MGKIKNGNEIVNFSSTNFWVTKGSDQKQLTKQKNSLH